MMPSELRAAAKRHGMRFIVYETGGVGFFRDLGTYECSDDDASNLTDSDLASIATELDTISARVRANSDAAKDWSPGV